MAAAPQAPDALSVLKMILFILFIVFIVWFFFGGKDRAENTSEPFLHPAAPLDSGDEFGVFKEGEPKGPIIHAW